MTCPSADVLERFLAGAPLEPDPEARAAHIRSCPTCQAALTRLSRDKAPRPSTSHRSADAPGPTTRLDNATVVGEFLGAAVPQPDRAPRDRSGPTGRLGAPDSAEDLPGGFLGRS
jgi:hypothetical protein